MTLWGSDGVDAYVGTLHGYREAIGLLSASTPGLPTETGDHAGGRRCAAQR